jgi:hypothetical protein
MKSLGYRTRRKVLRLSVDSQIHKITWTHNIVSSATHTLQVIYKKAQYGPNTSYPVLLFVSMFVTFVWYAQHCQNLQTNEEYSPVAEWLLSWTEKILIQQLQSQKYSPSITWRYSER